MILVKRSDIKAESMYTWTCPKCGRLLSAHTIPMLLGKVKKHAREKHGEEVVVEWES